MNIYLGRGSASGTCFKFNGSPFREVIKRTDLTGPPQEQWSTTALLECLDPNKNLEKKLDYGQEVTLDAQTAEVLRISEQKVSPLYKHGKEGAGRKRGPLAQIVPEEERCGRVRDIFDCMDPEPKRSKPSKQLTGESEESEIGRAHV